MKIEINSYIRHGSLREIHWQASSPGRTGQPHVYASGHGIVVSQNEHSVTLDNGVEIPLEWIITVGSGDLNEHSFGVSSAKVFLHSCRYYR